MPKTFLGQFRDLLKGSSSIKVGVITSRVGPIDYYGKMQIQGLELGLEYATQGTWKVRCPQDTLKGCTQRADRPIELLIEDDAGDPATGGQKARALIENQRVHILQGCASSAVTIVVAQVAQEYERILLVEPAAADSITGAHFNRYIFRTGASVSQDAAAGGKYAVEHLGRTFCFIAPDYIWGHQSNAAWKRVVEEHGGKALKETLVPPNTTDFTPYLREILEIRPDVLVQSWAGAGYRQLFGDMRKLGIFDKMRVTGGLGDREARHALGMNAIGMVGIIKYSHILPHNPINDWLTAKHIERHGEPPDLFTGGGFAAGVALVQALDRTGGNPEAEALIQVMEGMSFEGPKGTYTFRREDHQALQPMYVVEMVPDPDPQHPYAIPKLIQEMTPEETAPPCLVKSG